MSQIIVSNEFKEKVRLAAELAFKIRIQLAAERAFKEKKSSGIIDAEHLGELKFFIGKKPKTIIALPIRVEAGPLKGQTIYIGADE